MKTKLVQKIEAAATGTDGRMDERMDPSFMMKLHDIRKKEAEKDKGKDKDKDKDKSKGLFGRKKEEVKRELRRLESTSSPFPDVRARRIEELRSRLKG